MAYWMYKCNAKRSVSPVYRGNWNVFFESSGAREWGNAKRLPALRQLSAGDIVIAYQTDRNELVGVAEVVENHGRSNNVMMKQKEEIRAKVRPLKRANEKIAKTPALKQGYIRTLYTISPADAKRLLKAARNANQARTPRIEPTSPSA